MKTYKLTRREIKELNRETIKEMIRELDRHYGYRGKENHHENHR